MKKTIILISSIALFAIACNNEVKTIESTTEPQTTEASTSEASIDVNSTPEKVIETIYNAAKNNDFSQLGMLCNESVKADGDSRGICELQSGSKEANVFVQYFQTLKLDGSPEINGDMAKVNVFLGDGKETLSMKKVDGKWYLESF